MVNLTTPKKILDLMINGPVLVRSDENTAARDRTQIMKHTTTMGNQSVTIHTVTTGKTFFLTSCSITFRSESVQQGNMRIDFASSGGTTENIMLFIYNEGPGHGVATMSFPMPLKLAAGKLVRLDVSDFGGTTFIVGATIQGWEE